MCLFIVAQRCRLATKTHDGPAIMQGCSWEGAAEPGFTLMLDVGVDPTNGT